MQLEIEMKAWVRNPIQLEKKLSALNAVYVRDYRKEDRYFRYVERNPAGQKIAKQDVRIRVDGSIAMVTYKDKRIAKGLEINHEQEFEISDPDLMRNLLYRLGAEDYVEKIKIGSAWRWGELLVEVSEILGLGHFVEIEHVVIFPEGTPPNEQDAQVKNSELLIIEAFKSLDIPESDRESRPYTGMLVALKQADAELSF